MGRAPHPRNTSRAMARTCWRPEAEAALAQVEGRSSWEALSRLVALLFAHIWTHPGMQGDCCGSMVWLRPYMRLLVEDTKASEPCGICARFPVLHVLAMLEGGLECALHMHIAKQRMMLDGALQSHIAATVPGLAAAIARECMAAWTREALAKRRDRQGGGHSA
jgi:hypothetical protein